MILTPAGAGPVLGLLPFALARRGPDYKVLAAGVVAYSAAVMFVWLNFADDASSWVPYSLTDVDRLVGHLLLNLGKHREYAI